MIIKTLITDKGVWYKINTQHVKPLLDDDLLTEITIDTLERERAVADKIGERDAVDRLNIIVGNGSVVVRIVLTPDQLDEIGEACHTLAARRRIYGPRP